MTKFNNHICTECKKEFQTVVGVGAEHCPYCGDYPGDHRLS